MSAIPPPASKAQTNFTFDLVNVLTVSWYKLTRAKNKYGDRNLNSDG